MKAIIQNIANKMGNRYQANPEPNFLRKYIRSLGLDIVRLSHHGYPKDFDYLSPSIIDIINAAKPYTMTNPENIFALIQAVGYIVRNDIPGSIVECGVWKGGSMVAAVKTLLKSKNSNRDLYLFDTFEGMPAPTEADVTFAGKEASIMFSKTKKPDINGSDWCNAPVDEVRETLYKTGYSQDKIHLIKGKVEDTIPQHAPDNISLLRLDTDWYESTYHELVHLFPRLSPQGVIIIDDYGNWQGARKAVDEYFTQNKISILLNRIDSTGARIGINV